MIHHDGVTQSAQRWPGEASMRLVNPGDRMPLKANERENTMADDNSERTTPADDRQPGGPTLPLNDDPKGGSGGGRMINPSKSVPPAFPPGGPTLPLNDDPKGGSGGG